MSSLQERIAARREQRQRDRSFVLPIPGYEDIGLAARYRVLPYEELRKIGKQNEQIADTPKGELAEYADTLIRACVELLVKEGDGYQSLGCRWIPAGIREQLGIDLPAEATARDALFAVFCGPSGGNDLFFHFRAYSAEAEKVAAFDDEETLGESEARSETEALSISQ